MRFDLLYMQILSFGLIILAAFFGGRISRRLHVGEVVGQVVGGLVMGPVLLFFLEHKMPVYREAVYSLHFLAFIFLGIVAFSIGEELHSDKIRRVGKDAIIICIVQAVATWVLVTVTFLFLGLKTTTALIIGSIGIATAPASTFVIMNKLGITGRMRSMLGGIVVLDDVIEVIIFSVMAQIALLLKKNAELSLDEVFLPVAKDFALALLLGIGVYILLRLVVRRKWLYQKDEKGEKGGVLGPELLSRLISEMPGPSIQTFILIWGSVSLGIGFALYFHLPFLVTAVAAGILIANLYSRDVFESLRIENATSMYTLIFFALIGANADIGAFHPENYLYVGAYIAARFAAKYVGTWVGCKLTKQEARLTRSMPKLMLPQAGVAAIEAFFVATVLGSEGNFILGIILPGVIFFEIFGVLASERALIKWRSWVTGGGDLIGEEEIIKDKLSREKIDITQFIRSECLCVPMEVRSKGEAIWKFLFNLQSLGYVENPGDVLDRILERERQGGITIGEGIAILHGRIPGLSEPIIALGVLPKDHGINFGAMEEAPIDIIYMVLSPEGKPEIHLQILASIAQFLSNPDIRARLRYAKNENEAFDIIKEHSIENS